MFSPLCTAACSLACRFRRATPWCGVNRRLAASTASLIDRSVWRPGVLVHPGQLAFTPPRSLSALSSPSAWRGTRMLELQTRCASTSGRPLESARLLRGRGSGRLAAREWEQVRRCGSPWSDIALHAVRVITVVSAAKGLASVARSAMPACRRAAQAGAHCACTRSLRSPSRAPRRLTTPF